MRVCVCSCFLISSCVEEALPLPDEAVPISETMTVQDLRDRWYAESHVPSITDDRSENRANEVRCDCKVEINSVTYTGNTSGGSQAPIFYDLFSPDQNCTPVGSSACKLFNIFGNSYVSEPQDCLNGSVGPCTDHVFPYPGSSPIVQDFNCQIPLYSSFGVRFGAGAYSGSTDPLSICFPLAGDPNSIIVDYTIKCSQSIPRTPPSNQIYCVPEEPISTLTGQFIVDSGGPSLDATVQLTECGCKPTFQ